jgi:hypothetical protein
MWLTISRLLNTRTGKRMVGSHEEKQGNNGGQSSLTRLAVSVNQA